MSAWRRRRRSFESDGLLRGRGPVRGVAATDRHAPTSTYVICASVVQVVQEAHACSKLGICRGMCLQLVTAFLRACGSFLGSASTCFRVASSPEEPVAQSVVHLPTDPCNAFLCISCVANRVWQLASVPVAHPVLLAAGHCARGLTSSVQDGRRRDCILCQLVEAHTPGTRGRGLGPHDRASS